jgi:thiol:disulfide interchange protein
MTFLRRTWFLFLLLTLQGVASAQLHEVGNGFFGPVKAAHVIAELKAGNPGGSPGANTDVALILQLEAGWHVYWRNAGDAGEPPSAEWITPPGIAVGPMQFLTPKRLPVGPLMDYGYEGTAVFPFAVGRDRLAPLAGATTITTRSAAHLQAHVRWLVCREVCLPGKAFLGVDLPNSATPETQASESLIASAIKAEPVALPPGDSVQVSASRDHLELAIKTGQREDSAEFYPLDEDALRNAADQIVVPNSKGALLKLERGDISDTIPKHLKGILKLSGDRSYLVDAPVQSMLTSTRTASTLSGGLAFAILLAFAGGLVLNLMPCVFPILFLKAISLVDSANQDRRAQRLHGLFYTAGILASFWAIVAVLLLLRAGGRQAGWGFQLQSPSFVAVMASMLFLMALSLAGQFDLGLSLTNKGDALTRKSGYAGSFFTGVLATVVATPCTAPLMGAAIGFALSQPAVVTFAVFTALALGLASPYLFLTLNPGWSKWMPRPGRWMETLKQLTALPLLLTVVWLVWVYGRLYSSESGGGSDPVARLLAGLVVLAVAGWALARWPGQRLGMVAALGLIAASLTISLTTATADRLQWQPFSAAAINHAQAEGRPVFVDFTAAWCLSCQFNEHSVLHDASVERQLDAKHYVLLRADWTRYDPEITRQLASVSRSGVPTYVIYSPSPSGRVQVLPELLSRSVVLTALSQPGS